MTLTPFIQSFISHFGEIGRRWGISPTEAKIYALLLVTEQQLHADDIGHKLGISRSNVSIGLKELGSWGLVRQSRFLGDRREYFSSLGDTWEIFRAIAAERSRREIVPTLSVLHESLLTAPTSAEDAFAQQRMREMHDLMSLTNNWVQELQRLSPESIAQLMKMGSNIQKLLSSKDKFLGSSIKKEN